MTSQTEALTRTVGNTRTALPQEGPRESEVRRTAAGHRVGLATTKTGRTSFTVVSLNSRHNNSSSQTSLPTTIPYLSIPLQHPHNNNTMDEDKRMVKLVRVPQETATTKTKRARNRRAEE
jgi:hypothetical protein